MCSFENPLVFCFIRRQKRPSQPSRIFMTFNQLSSGDLIADRRADYAKMLADAGDAPGAAELMAQALELAPDWAAGWFRLADYEEKSGRKEAAVDALRHTLRLNPEDIFGASLKLALLGATDTPEQPPSVYVERLFDDYAERFDQALVEKLDYSVPEKLAALIARMTDGGHFRRVADLGCGTGLFGERIRARAEILEGFDLSANMLAKAEAKGIYDRLGQADLSLVPEELGGLRRTVGAACRSRQRRGCHDVSRHTRKRLRHRRPAAGAGRALRVFRGGCRCVRRLRSETVAALCAYEGLCRFSLFR